VPGVRSTKFEPAKCRHHGWPTQTPRPVPFASATETSGRILFKDVSQPQEKRVVTDLQWLLIDFFQALASGLMVGGTYGLLCLGLGIIFGVMRVVNFAQGDFMMLGMYIAYYLVTGFGVLTFLGPYAAPIVGAALAGPVVFVIGWLLHRYLISQVTGVRVIS